MDKTSLLLKGSDFQRRQWVVATSYPQYWSIGRFDSGLEDIRIGLSLLRNPGQIFLKDLASHPLRHRAVDHVALPTVH